jgi:hypothetical protein
VIVVDVPAQDRRAACEQVRHHHGGRLLVLLTRERAATTCHPTPTRRCSPARSSSMSGRPRWQGPDQPYPPPIPRTSRGPSRPGRPSPAGSGRALAVGAAWSHSMFVG